MSFATRGYSCRLARISPARPLAARLADVSREQSSHDPTPNKERPLELLLLSLLAIVLFVIMSLRRQGADLASLSSLDHVGPWLDERDINREVQFVNYAGRPFAETEDATVVLGHGRDADGRTVGFCVEVRALDGIVAGILVEPPALVLTHRKAARHSRKTGKPLRIVLAHSMTRRG